jgi:hypothetical protein
MEREKGKNGIEKLAQISGIGICRLKIISMGENYICLF